MRIFADEDQLSENVTVYENEPDVFDPRSEILRYTVPDGLQALLYDETVFNIKLYDDVPAEISLMSLGWLMVKRAGQDQEEEVAKFEYAPFQRISLIEQMNSDFRESVLVKLHRGQSGLAKPVVLSQGDSLRVWLKSENVVSWLATKKSKFSFDLSLSRIVPLRV